MPPGTKEQRSELLPVRAFITAQQVSSLLIQQADDNLEPQETAVGGQDLYFELLELQPIKLSLSFVRTERVSSDGK